MIRGLTPPARLVRCPPMCRAFLACLVLLVPLARARGEILPTFPLRELTIQAEAVVVAEPAGGGTPGRAEGRLAWVERHRAEFAGGRALPWVKGHAVIGDGTAGGPAAADLEGRGWGELERLPLLWVFEGGSPAEAWRALQVYAELNE